MNVERKSTSPTPGSQGQVPEFTGETRHGRPDFVLASNGLTNVVSAVKRLDQGGTVPKPLMNWFERRIFLKRLAAAGSRAVAESAFATEPSTTIPHLRVPDDPRSVLEATEWRTHAVSGPGEGGVF